MLISDTEAFRLAEHVADAGAGLWPLTREELYHQVWLLLCGSRRGEWLTVRQVAAALGNRSAGAVGHVLRKMADGGHVEYLTSPQRFRCPWGRS